MTAMDRRAFLQLMAAVGVLRAGTLRSTAQMFDEGSRALWYRRLAARWVEALPFGNGRLGGMVFGGIGVDRLQLNDDTLWSGGPKAPRGTAGRSESISTVP